MESERSQDASPGVNEMNATTQTERNLAALDATLAECRLVLEALGALEAARVRMLAAAGEAERVLAAA